MFKRFALFFMLPLLVLSICCLYVIRQVNEARAADEATTIALPAPACTSNVTVEQALQQRRSIRTFSDAPITLAQASQLLWAARGLPSPRTGTARRRRPMRRIHCASTWWRAMCRGCQPGCIAIFPRGISWSLSSRATSAATIGDQAQMQTPPALLAFTADYTSTAKKYGAQAPKMAYIELGHAAENVLLEEVALGLVGVPMGGINVEKMSAALKLSKSEVPLYLVAAGYKR